MIRADQEALYLNDMYKAFYEAYDEEKPKYPEIFKVVKNVEGAGDKETMLLGPAGLRKRDKENQQIRFRSPVQAWEFFCKYDTYDDGIFLSKEEVDDTRKLGNLLKTLASGWGEKSTQKKEETAATVFNEGGNTSGNDVFNGSHTGNSDSSGDLLYDSKPMFNLTGNSRRVYSQTSANASYYNSVASVTLTPTNFETLYNLATVTNAVDERERKIKFTVDTLLVESGSQRFLADRILKTERGIPFSQNNDLNPYYNIVAPMDWRYLDDSSAFYVGKRQHKDFQFRERQEPEIRFWRDEDTLGYKASFNERFGIFIKNFRVWTRGGGTYA